VSRVFELLFKYRPIVFEEGHLALGAPGALRLWLLGGGVLAAVAVASYTLARGRTRPAERVVMAGLRVALLATLLFCFLQPVLVLSTVVPQQNFVGVVIDDSRSMQLVDADGRPRSDFVREAFTPGQSKLLHDLEARFTVRFFRFSAATSRVDSLAGLTYDGTHTYIGAALDAARQELAGVPLSGLVLVSDGADNSSTPLTPSLVPLQAAGVPVFTVGVGDESVSPDIEMGRVDMPRSVLRGSDLLVDVVVTQTGMGRRSVPLIVENDQRILARQQVELGPDGEPVVTRVRLRLDSVGPMRLRFRIPVQEGERVAQNNQREVDVKVLGERAKVLYFEGEPRYEVKFIREAETGDPNIQVVVLLRTAPRKFLRLDVDSANELVDGFPRTRAELYRYRALVLGSIEASYFSHDQLQMIADFVSQRGGGLLMLGGPRSFAEGGWAGTPVEEVLPVILGAPAKEQGGAPAEIKVAPTPAGLANPVVQLGAAPGDVAARWDSLPTVTRVNPISELRPGATALLAGTGQGLSADQVVLAHQRYGRGKALALTIQDDYLWRMGAQVPLSNHSQEIFWQQLMRWLVEGVPDEVSATLARDRVESGGGAHLTVEVNDSSFIEVNDARVSAHITSPSGAVTDTAMAWVPERDGEYALDFNPAEDGEYRIDVSATRGGHTLGADEVFLRVAPSEEEYFGAGRRTQLLKRIARETGGRFYTPRTVATLPADIAVTGAGVTLTEQRDLWDMPALFLLMVALMGAEWWYRRSRGLA
jgi:uncharacterized membrane protein